MNQKLLIMDIALNIARIGNWTADDFVGKKKRIGMFLKQTHEYLGQVNGKVFSPRLQKTLTRFSSEFFQFDRELQSTPKDTNLLAEKLMTWANILTHRFSLA